MRCLLVAATLAAAGTSRQDSFDLFGSFGLDEPHLPSVAGATAPYANRVDDLAPGLLRRLSAQAAPAFASCDDEICDPLPGSCDEEICQPIPGTCEDEICQPLPSWEGCDDELCTPLPPPAAPPLPPPPPPLSPGSSMVTRVTTSLTVVGDLATFDVTAFRASLLAELVTGGNNGVRDVLITARDEQCDPPPSPPAPPPSPSAPNPCDDELCTPLPLDCDEDICSAIIPTCDDELCTPLPGDPPPPAPMPPPSPPNACDDELCTPLSPTPPPPPSPCDDELCTPLLAECEEDICSPLPSTPCDDELCTPLPLTCDEDICTPIPPPPAPPPSSYPCGMSIILDVQVLTDTYSDGSDVAEGFTSLPLPTELNGVTVWAITTPTIVEEIVPGPSPPPPCPSRRRRTRSPPLLSSLAR